MSTYCTQTDIERTYGTTNVAEWADVDNDGNATTKSNMITRSIAVASEMIDDAARCWHYAIPLTDGSTTPTTINDLAASLAGLWLYENRGSQDYDPQTGVPYHKLHWKRQSAMLYLELIAAGKRKINAL